MSFRPPSAIGGTLIRLLISELRAQGIELPIRTRVVIAVSGGADSMALAHLIAHHGRKICRPEQLMLLHVNHGWRGADSDSDSRFVARCARQWGVEVRRIRLRARKKDGLSPEEAARERRQKIYRKLSREYGGAPVLTAHHGDDLAETLLWRLFTGASRTHGAGIRSKHGPELRPFLGVRKKRLIEYLKSEGQEWREDSTNHQGELLRSRLRKEVMPPLEGLFPQAVERLIELGRAASNDKAGVKFPPIDSVFSSVTGHRLRRPHYECIRKALLDPQWTGPLALPGGWELRKEVSGPAMTRRVRWILTSQID